MPIERVAFAVGCSLCLGASAQTAVRVPEPPPAGTVVGQVVYADTQRPARFAQVYVILRQDPAKIPPQTSYTGPNGGQTLVARSAPGVVMMDGRTGLDGSYTIAGVPPADYFVMAVEPGYVLPITPQKTPDDAKDIDKLLAGVPLVHVTADRTAEANVSMRRGGVITGRVHFDDGAPVAGVQVSLRRADTPYEMGFSAATGALNNILSNQQRWTTDDDGRFRAPGLQPGKYSVSVYLPLGTQTRVVATAQGQTFGGVAGSPGSLVFYAPGVQRKADAAQVEVRGTETVADTDIAVGLNALHSVSGRAVAQEDGRPANRGNVFLIDTADKDFQRYGPVQADGSWRIGFVPAGTYTLRLIASEVDDPDPLTYGTKVTTIRSFAKIEQEVIVGDHDQAVGDLQLQERIEAAKPASAP